MNRSSRIANKASSAADVSPARSGLLQRNCACKRGGADDAPCKTCAPLWQAKLSIGATSDALEHEADRVADQVLAGPAHALIKRAPPRIQRFTGQVNASADTAPASVDSVLASPGRPMDAALQQDMEQRFSHDFSQVRVHSGAAAEQSARDVNANAYTVGDNIVFGAGRFSPETREGRRLIAHELTHVVQQSGLDDIRVGQSNEKCDLSSSRSVWHNRPTVLARQAVNTEAGGLPKPSSVETVVLSCSSNDISFFTNQGVFRYPLTICDLSDGEYEATVTTKGKNVVFDLGKAAPEGVRFRFQYNVEAGQTDPSEFFAHQKEVQIIARTTGTSLPTSASIAQRPFGDYVDRFADVVYDLDYNKQGTSLSPWLRVRFADGTVIDINIYNLEDKKMTSQEVRDALAQGYVGKGGRIFPLRMNAQTTPRLWAARQAAIEEMEKSNIEFMTLSLAAVMIVITLPAMPAGMAPGGGGGPPRANVRRVPRGNGGMPPPTEGTAAPSPEGAPARTTPAPEAAPAQGAQAPGPRQTTAAAAPSPADILTPGGSPIGRPGASAGIRRVNGGLPAAQKMFDQLSAGGKDVTPKGYPGRLVDLPNGGRVGLRPVSSSADLSPSIDVNISGVKVTKIHFEP